MSTRNPNNDRYRTDGPVGQTRKSAASAKPKKKAAETVYVRDPSKKKKSERAPKSTREALQQNSAKQALTPEEKQKRKEEQRILREEQNIRIEMEGPITDPKYKFHRRIWWALVVLAIVSTALSFAFRYLIADINTPSVVTLCIAYASIIGSLIYDSALCRPYRTEQKARTSTPMSKKQRKEFDDYVARKSAQLAAKPKTTPLEKIKNFFGINMIRKQNVAKAGAVSEQIEQEEAALADPTASSGDKS